MPDYLPPFDTGTDLTLTTSTPVIGGQVVAVSGPRTIAPTTTATPAWLGVVKQDAAAGARVGVAIGGLHELTAAGAISAGDVVTTAAAGRVATFTGTTYTEVVGIALTSAADGARVLIKLAR